MYEPISYLRRKFRYAFIQEIVLNMKNMLDMGRLVFPMENTFIIVVIRVYDDTANPSVSNTLRYINIEIIGYRYIYSHSPRCLMKCSPKQNAVMDFLISTQSNN